MVEATLLNVLNYYKVPYMIDVYSKMFQNVFNIRDV